MIQPIIGAINAWLAILAALPWAIRALMSLAVFFLVLSKVIIISFGAKGD